MNKHITLFLAAIILSCNTSREENQETLRTELLKVVKPQFLILKKQQ